MEYIVMYRHNAIVGKLLIEQEELVKRMESNPADFRIIPSFYKDENGIHITEFSVIPGYSKPIKHIGAGQWSKYSKEEKDELNEKYDVVVVYVNEM